MNSRRAKKQRKEWKKCWTDSQGCRATRVGSRKVIPKCSEKSENDEVDHIPVPQENSRIKPKRFLTFKLFVSHKPIKDSLFQPIMLLFMNY